MKEGEDFNYTESAETMFNQTAQGAEDITNFWSINADVIGALIAFIFLFACICMVGMFFFWVVKRFHN